MDQNEGQTRPPLTRYEDIAKMIDHSLLRPELTLAQVKEGCEVARRYHVASVCVRPCDVEVAAGELEGSDVLAGSVVGFPHGATTTAAKLFETRQMIEQGAREVDMVLNIGRLLSGECAYVETEIRNVAALCHANGAILKVIFENAYLTDEMKVVACGMCKRSKADFVKTSTGFAPGGATIPDLKLMYKHASPECRLKAAGGVRTLEAAIEVYEAGCSRFGATATVSILEDWKKRLAQAAGT
jgi:deoxyribose-phosphate aldolase